jgi:hypothetical protein
MKGVMLSTGTRCSFLIGFLCGFCVDSFGANETPTSQTYSNEAAKALIQRASQISASLSDAGLIPVESASNTIVNLEGQSTHPWGRVSFSSCQYEFDEGLIKAIRRKDFFEDKGPESLILAHLTNEVLTLTKEVATNRAFDVLRCLSYDPERIKATHRIRVRDDMMDAYPLRNGGPNFPKDLHFYGELISRKKIRMIVEMLANIPNKEQQFVGDAQMRIEFLATTGELLEVRWPPNQQVSKLLGIRAPEPITLADTADFSSPLFFSAQRVVTGPAINVTSEEAVNLVNETWKEMEDKFRTNIPKLVLVCDNLNRPVDIANALKKLTGEIPWAGVSHTFNMGLPFELSKMSRLAEGKRGVALLAICGNMDVQLDVVSDLVAQGPEIDWDRRDESQQRYQQIKEEFTPRVGPLLERLKFLPDVPDHVLFLMQPAANYASSVINSELENRLRGNARVISVMGASDSFSIGDGITYFRGDVYSNAIALVRLSGSFPLQADHHYALALAAARLSKPPPGYDLAKIQARGPARILSGEVINPVRNLAYSFGPHPMQVVAHFFGEKWIRFLQEADKVDVYRVHRHFLLDEPERSGPKTVEGYDLLRTGETLDVASARRLASAVLDEQIGLSVSNCEFDPGVVFQIWRERQYARLIVCFTCGEAGLAFYDADGKRLHSSLPFHFWGGHAVLLELARKGLPNDPDLEKR